MTTIIEMREGRKTGESRMQDRGGRAKGVHRGNRMLIKIINALGNIINKRLAIIS